MNVLAIDPGPVQSAFVIWDGERILEKGKVDNQAMLVFCVVSPKPSACIIEQIKGLGMAVADSVFDTVYWTGRFAECWISQQRGFFDRVPRKEVKLHLCNSMRAKDSNIIQALKDRFEPELLPRQRPKGILKGLVDDEWQAFALAVTWYDQQVSEVGIYTTRQGM